LAEERAEGAQKHRDCRCLLVVVSGIRTLLSQMKYVMFTHRKTGLKVPTFFSDHISHCDVKVGDEWVATSAGSFDLRTFQAVGKSSSLNMSPAPDDWEVCKLVICGVESMLYLAQNTKKNLRLMNQLLKKQAKPKSPAAVTIYSPP
jgi:hypothetical protein